jgi:hypothetical protein
VHNVNHHGSPRQHRPATLQPLQELKLCITAAVAVLFLTPGCGTKYDTSLKATAIGVKGSTKPRPLAALSRPWPASKSCTPALDPSGPSMRTWPTTLLSEEEESEVLLLIACRQVQWAGRQSDSC